jgi:hypothetical protein
MSRAPGQNNEAGRDLKTMELMMMMEMMMRRRRRRGKKQKIGMGHRNGRKGSTQLE